MKILRSVLFFLAACLIFLALSHRGTETRVSAAAPALIPNASVRSFLPLISNPSPVSYSPLWRFGTDKVRRPFSAYNPADLSNMRFGWYIDFSTTDNPETFSGMDYVPVVNMKLWKQMPDGTQTLCCVGCAYTVPATYVTYPPVNALPSMAAAHPGRTWIVGNEQERIDTGTGSACASQNEMVPEVYAQVYHDVYFALKSGDSTAQIAFGPMVQPSPLRIEYLNRVWAEYTRRYGGTMPVDVWSVHIYVYNEQKGAWGADIPAGLSETSGTIRQIQDTKNFAIAAQLIVGWRTWMRDHGQQNKPLITPEYGANLPDWILDDNGNPLFTPPQIRDSYLYPSFDYFLNHTDASIGFPADGNRLVQRWAWWSMDFDDGTCIDANTYHLLNSGALFYSGLGPSAPPANCPVPSQGLAPLGNYWIAYVKGLPAGRAKPYAPVRSPVTAGQSASVPSSVSASADSAIVKYADQSELCSDSPEVRTRFLQTLPNRNTPEGQQAWIRALSALSAGTRICMQ